MFCADGYFPYGSEYTIAENYFINLIKNLIYLLYNENMIGFYYKNIKYQGN